MELLIQIAAGDLRALNERQVRKGRLQRHQVRSGVVVRQGQDADPGLLSGAEQLHGGQTAVGQTAVGVQVDIASFHQNFSFCFVAYIIPMFRARCKWGCFIKNCRENWGK